LIVRNIVETELTGLSKKKIEESSIEINRLLERINALDVENRLLTFKLNQAAKDKSVLNINLSSL